MPETLTVSVSKSSTLLSVSVTVSPCSWLPLRLSVSPGVRLMVLFVIMIGLSWLPHSADVHHRVCATKRSGSKP